MKLSSLLIAGLVIATACAPRAQPTPPPAAPTASPTATVTPLPTSVPPTALPTDTPTPAPTDTPAPDLSSYVSDFPDPAGYQWAEYVTGLTQPVGIENAGDGSGRLFIVERAGRIQIVKPGTPAAGGRRAVPPAVAKAPFLDISSKILSFAAEQGLLGLAFDPNYATNGRFYVNYTDQKGDTVIARYNVSADNPDLADPESESILLQVAQPFLNHNGGSLEFGSDGYLYMGLGDGGSQGDPFANAQSLDTLLGKILRVDVSGDQGYSVPPDNPFANGGGQPEIWAYGLRNPWRIAFDSANGNLYIADVGQSDWEEIDFVPAGAPGGMNFGWNIMEGNHLYAGGPTEGLIPPVVEYSHAEGGCSVVGGQVYRGAEMPEWNGVYLYGDDCSGKIWGLLPTASGWKSDLLFDSGFSITTFGLDESGELYVTNYKDGSLHRLARP